MKISKGNSISSLPLDCIFKISTFLETYDDFIGLVLSVKGFFEYLVTFKPTNTSIVFHMYHCPEFKPNEHKYSYVQNLRIVEEEKMFSFSSLDFCQVLSHFSKLRVLTIENTRFLPNSNESPFNFGLHSDQLRNISLNIPFSNMYPTWKGIDFNSIPNLEKFSAVGYVDNFDQSSFDCSEEEEEPEYFNHLRIYFKGKARKLKKLHLEKIRCCNDFDDYENVFDLKVLSHTIESLILIHSEFLGFPITSERFPELKKLCLLDYNEICRIRDLKLEKLEVRGQLFPLEGVEVSHSLNLRVFKEKTFQEICRYKTLRKLDVSFRHRDLNQESKLSADFSVFENLKVLRIECSDYGWSREQKDDDIFRINGNLFLEKLEVVNCISPVFLQDLPQLSSLKVSRPNLVSHKQMVFLKRRNVNNIKKLILENLKTFPKGITLSKIEDLVLSKCFSAGMRLEYISDEVFKSLRNLKILNSNWIEREVLVHGFRGDFKNLKSLYISHFKDQTLGIRSIQGLPDHIMGEIVRIKVLDNLKMRKRKYNREKFQFESKQSLLKILTNNY